MTDLLETREVQSLLIKVSGLGNYKGSPRVKRIVHRRVGPVQDNRGVRHPAGRVLGRDEHLTELGQANEVGLLVPGLGLETFLDLRTDEAERKTPRGRFG